MTGPLVTPLERGAHEVLVVDDNHVTRYATSRVLRAAGFRTREAGTGAEALAHAADGVSAVVLDVHLPDFDGFEVVRRLRRQPATARLPVIHLSAAHVRDDDKVRGLDSGADAYLTHPAEPAVLIATVQALVRTRLAEEAMRRSEARFRAIYDQAPSGICLLDDAGAFVDANPAMLALLQREAGAVVGRRVADFAPPDWRERVAQWTSGANTGPWHGQFPLLDAAGQPVQLAWSVSPHPDPGLRMAIATDVRERLRLEQQREQLLEREQAARAAAERALRSRDDFIAVLSHELRTPLNAITGWAHVLQKRGVPDDVQPGLRAIERNAKTQARLISDILDVSRMSMGKLRLDPERVDPAELTAASVAALAPSFADKRLEVRQQLAPGAPMWLDPARYQQIVWNLLTNAIKFSQPGAAIDVGLQRDAAGLVLTVADHGQGIRPEFLPYLFDRFTQGDSSSNRYHGGLGLGLSIVKHLVELHGGTVEGFSEGAGHGARFEVRLPDRALAAEQPAAEPAASGFGELGEPRAPEPALAGVKVLVVDDDAEACAMLSVILGDRGAEVLAVQSGEAALAALETFAADVVVSDIGMPGADGYAFVRELRRREDDGPARLPAIALTAFTRQQDREMARETGFDAHCDKPVRPGVLVERILELLRRV